MTDPNDWSCSRTAGVSIACTVAACSLLTIAAGVFLGRKKAVQL